MEIEIDNWIIVTEEKVLHNDEDANYISVSISDGINEPKKDWFFDGNMNCMLGFIETFLDEDDAYDVAGKIAFEHYEHVKLG